MPDPAAGTAEAQLARILYILAAARGEDGVSVRELATRLGVEPATIRDDVAEVTGREFYHPAASVLEMTILLERGRISVPVAGEFRRPMRLTPREAGALGLALRARAAEATSPLREELRELASSLEKALTAPTPRTHRGESGRAGGRGTAPGTGTGTGTFTERHSLAAALAIDPGAGGEGVRLLLSDAIARRVPVRITYVKPGDSAPVERALHPYALVTAEGTWYVLGHSPERGSVREFRLDRILAAALGEGSFEVPKGFRPDHYTHEGKAYHAAEDTEAVVRYAARVAPWVREHWGGEEQADGSLVVRHRVGDPRWLVRQVLGFAGDAVVEAPAELREAVRRAADGVAGRNG